MNWSPHPQMKTFLILLSVVLFILSACQAPSKATPPRVDQQRVTPKPPSQTPPLSPTVTETAVLAAGAERSTPKPEKDPDTTPVVPDFNLDTPTITSTQDAIWRPPGYPIPWAPSLYDHFYFASPIAAKDMKLPLSEYRYGNVFFDDHVHTGIDIRTNLQKPVYAAGDGKVIWSGYGLYRGGYQKDDPYGISVVIRHSFSYQGQTLFTIYAHLAEAIAEEGDQVQAGDVIGIVGETGHTTGPHLHFEVRVGTNDFFSTYNPVLWIAPPKGWGILVGRIESTYGRPLSDQAVFVSEDINPEEEDDDDEEEDGQVWRGKTYRNLEDINADPYYRENFVLGNLPAGTYRVNIPYVWKNFSRVIEIRPGEVTYLTFQGFNGFTVGALPEPEISFTPAP